MKSRKKQSRSIDADTRGKEVSGSIPESFSVELAGSPETAGEPASHRGQTPAGGGGEGRGGDTNKDGNRTLLLLVK